MISSPPTPPGSPPTDRSPDVRDTRPPSEAAGTSDHHARVVIVGAGFGGLACAQRLGRAGIDTLVIDRRNHTLFQPLLYQVATAALSPADIAEPIRKTLGRYASVRVMLAEVTGVTGRQLRLSDGATVRFEQLVIATGSTYGYFSHDEWRPYAPGLKTLTEARLIRQRLLLAFERAELTDDPIQRRALLTMAIVGGGPTGVEMAGAIADLGQQIIRRDFRTLAKNDFRVLLVEAGPRILAGFPEPLATYAATELRRMGVELRLDSPVTAIGPDGIGIAGETVPVGCVVWAAGVQPSPAANWLGLADRARGRIPVDGMLAVPGWPGVHALGDTAAMDPPLPGLAQVARQQGRWLGDRIVAELAGKPVDKTPFRFRNRGNTAVIGRNAAVFDFGRWQLRGRLAWFLWAIVHVALLVNFEKRVLVTVQWTTRYLTRQRGARLVEEED